MIILHASLTSPNLSLNSSSLIKFASAFDEPSSRSTSPGLARGFFGMKLESFIFSCQNAEMKTVANLMKKYYPHSEDHSSCDISKKSKQDFCRFSKEDKTAPHKSLFRGKIVFDWLAQCNRRSLSSEMKIEKDNQNLNGKAVENLCLEMKFALKLLSFWDRIRRLQYFISPISCSSKPRNGIRNSDFMAPNYIGN